MLSRRRIFPLGFNVEADECISDLKHLTYVVFKLTGLMWTRSLSQVCQQMVTNVFSQLFYLRTVETQLHSPFLVYQQVKIVPGTIHSAEVPSKLRCYQNHSRPLTGQREALTSHCLQPLLKQNLSPQTEKLERHSFQILHCSCVLAVYDSFMWRRSNDQLHWGYCSQWEIKSLLPEASRETLTEVFYKCCCSSVTVKHFDFDFGLCF